MDRSRYICTCTHTHTHTQIYVCLCVHKYKEVQRQCGQYCNSHFDCTGIIGHIGCIGSTNIPKIYFSFKRNVQKYFFNLDCINHIGSIGSTGHFGCVSIIGHIGCIGSGNIPKSFFCLKLNFAKCQTIRLYIPYGQHWQHRPFWLSWQN